MEMINVKINGRDYSVPKNATVLEAAKIAAEEEAARAREAYEKALAEYELTKNEILNIRQNLRKIC